MVRFSIQVGAAGPPQGANCSGGSAAAALANDAASAGVVSSQMAGDVMAG